MSYARFAIDSNVYVFANVNGGMQCIIADDVAKKFQVEQTFFVKETLEPAACEKTMLGHLTYLKARGILVPDRAIDRLVQEITEIDNVGARVA